MAERESRVHARGEGARGEGARDGKEEDRAGDGEVDTESGQLDLGVVDKTVDPEQARSVVEGEGEGDAEEALRAALVEQSVLHGLEWRRVILDEAHRIKV